MAELMPPPGFPLEIDAGLHRVRDQIADIIESVCGGNARAKDVAQRFGVHAKLGWQIWNVAFSDPLAALRFLPNEHGLRLWLKAAMDTGVPPRLVEGLEEAVLALTELVHRHAGERDLFEMLLDARTDLKAEQRWRKQAFTGNSFIFGARAKAIVAAAIIFPSETDGFFSLVRINGLVDLIRTRAGVRWPIANLVIEKDGDPQHPRREPLDAAQSGGSPVLREFSSQPLPPIERREDRGVIHDELSPATVGLTGSTTVFTGEIVRNLGPTHSDREDEVAHFGTGIRTPAELLLSDHIVHRDIFPEARRELHVYSELASTTARAPHDELPVSEQLSYLGRGLNRVRTAEVPRYAELLQDAFDRIGFNPDDFLVYRSRMKYPPMPASAMVRHLMPRK